MLEITGKFCKDCKIFADTIEEEALQTIYGICDNQAFKDQKIRIMSDVHQGKGIVVGFSSTLGDYICPSHVGVDIGCQITSIILDKRLEESQYPLFDQRVKSTIPMGFDLREKTRAIERDLLQLLDQELKTAASSWPEMIEYEKVDQRYLDKLIKRIGIDPGVFYKSLGTMGGGNHFLEYGEGEEYPCALTIHCGSRNFGLKVCKYWESIAGKPKIHDTSAYARELDEIRQNTPNKRDIRKKIDELREKYLAMSAPSGYLEGDDLKGYLKDMVIAQGYAKYNHQLIKEDLLGIYRKLVQGAKVIEEIHTIHNYINFQDHIIRKGAVQARSGQLLILPFNMRDGLAICKGKGNKDWNYTCPRGAGRIMSRSKAKERITLKEYKDSMKGIYSSCVNQSTIDESPMAYKDTEEIINLIEPTVEILGFIKPQINFKAAE